VTARAPIMMRGRDGTIVEVSEWKSQEAINVVQESERPSDVEQVLRSPWLRFR
jgi:hypothetical protein